MTAMRRLARFSGSALSVPLVAIGSEVRIKKAAQPPTDRWKSIPVAPRGSTRIGISFRPLQAEALGLDPWDTFQTLLRYPFELVRLAAYWNRIEPEAGKFCPEEIDRQIDAAEQAGKQIILSVGGVKSYGYPEFFAPNHHLERPLREGDLVDPVRYRSLLDATTAFIIRIVERYRDRKAIIAWQVEHEAVDPLGVEHTWRLALPFVRLEVAAVRTADSTRPVMMNGFMATSLLVAGQQWWRTRDQGDSMSVAQDLADVVGIDYYPRHALVSFGARTVYLDGSRSPWQRWRERRLLAGIEANRRELIVAEGQAEPWEAVTTPPNPTDHRMYSCLPEDVIENYNRCMHWATGSQLSAYLFWGAEYWLLRRQAGDDAYIKAFVRIIERG